jgi:OHCU decarboxylase
VNTSPSDGNVDSFNALDDSEARKLLESCLAVERFVDEVMGARPYGSVAALVSNAQRVASTLDEAEVAAALARHPRIGERAGAGHDVEFSRSEQSGVDQSDQAVTSALAEGNAAYEAKFGRVFLIRAAGRSSEDILSELERRLRNSDEAEFAEVVRQLSEIAVLRLEQSVRTDTW